MKILTAVFAVFILAVIVLADTGHLGFLGFLYDFPHGDKAGHFILYGILAFLLDLTLLRTLPARNSIRVTVAVTLLLGLAIGIEEFSQIFFADRTASGVDLMFSYLGVAVGAWLAWRLVPKGG